MFKKQLHPPSNISISRESATVKKSKAHFKREAHPRAADYSKQLTYQQEF